MTLPPLSSKDDVLPFARHLLAEPALWELVEAFGPPVQLRAREQYLAGLVREWQARAEQARGEGDLKLHQDLRADCKQAALAVVNWVAEQESDPLPEENDVRARVSWLVRFAHRRWDLRCGEERDALPTRAEMVSNEIAATCYELAIRWGMRDPQPAAAAGHYEYLVVLGGLIRANLNRPRLAAELVTSGTVSTPSVIGLGAARRMSEAELELARRVRCPAGTEQEALEFGLSEAFTAQEARWMSTDVAHVRRLATTIGPTVDSVSAPMRLGKRADTATAFQWFVDEAEGLVRPGDAILSITTPIYWVASHTALLTQVPPGARLVTIGADPSKAPPELRQTFLSQHYLQEFKSTIDALLRLLAWSESEDA